MNHVFTYFEPASPEGEGLLNLWSQRWASMGWVPRVLGIHDARKHPVFEKFNGIVTSYPTANRPEYEMACWRRWVAFAMAARENGGFALCVDFDVVPQWRCPRHPHGYPVHRSRLTALTPVPTCAFTGSVEAIECFMMTAMNDAERGIVRVNGRLHVSDMTLAQAIPAQWTWNLIGEEWRADLLGSEGVLLLHASHNACSRAGITKEAAMGPAI